MQKRFLLFLSVLLITAPMIYVTTKAQVVSAKTDAPMITPTSQVAGSTPTPSPAAQLEFRLNAGVGKFPPTGSLYFLDNVVNNIKLFFKFSSDAKIIKRFDIGDKQIVHMKLVTESHSDDKLQQVVNNYKDNIGGISKLTSGKQLSDTMKQTVNQRIWDQEQAFLYLFSVANDKESPLLHDAWSQLETLKNSIK